MNWYKKTQQQEFRGMPPTAKDLEEEYYEGHLTAINNVLGEYKDRQPGETQSWPVVPFGRLKKIWQDYAKYGFVRDAKGMESIAVRMIENTHRLYANTYLMGHTPAKNHLCIPDTDNNLSSALIT